MKHSFVYSISLLMLALTACIKNDLPYPHETCVFESFVAENQSKSAEINTTDRTIKLEFPETVNLKEVRVSSYKISDGATIKSGSLDGTLDLSKAYSVTLYKYYDYKWTISATQTIERYFTVEGQVGSTTIDVAAKRVIVKVPRATDVTALKVLSAKLGPSGLTTYSKELEGKTFDFTDPLVVEVTYFGTKYTWTVIAERTDAVVTTERMDAWTNVLWVYGTGLSTRTNGIQYRKQGETTWTEATITQDGGSFKACINGVEANTTYEARAYSGEDFGSILTATTEGYLSIPNSSFDIWHYKDSKLWNPWDESGTSFWDTGNKGANTLNKNVTVPSDDTSDGGSGKSALLQSQFVGLSVIGKFAAGNIFTGEYYKTDGTNGILKFGREFTGRPTALKGHMKYTCKNIDNYNSETSYMAGKPDTAFIYMALTDWDEPFEVRTNPKNRQLFDPNDSHVIAYGALNYGQSVGSWTEFKVNLDYRDTSRKPKYILIVCAASKYGDYFTGGDGSELYLDNFSLEWKY